MRLSVSVSPFSFTELSISAFSTIDVYFRIPVSFLFTGPFVLFRLHNPLFSRFGRLVNTALKAKELCTLLMNVFVSNENMRKSLLCIGSYQFKVSNGDCIYTEKLKFCELILNKVLMLGSSNQTMIGRPVLPEANVHALVEKHKKRRKNYRRTKGHRQELTKLRIIDIQGIEKPEIPTMEKATTNKVEKTVVAA
ncbi:hypothetical protein LXL04_033277 [Taraxacum kok-saghyz]